MNNCFQISKKILELLEVRFTGNYLQEEVLSHPHFPSILTISDVMEKYNISTLPLKIGKNKLDQIPTPCIVQVRVQGKEYFQTLSHIAEDSFSGYDETGKTFKVSREDFLNIWTGVVLVVEKNDDTAEPGIEESIRKEKIQTFLIGGLALFALLALGFGWPDIIGTGYGLAAAAFLLLKLIGLGVSGLILWREIDKDNTLVQKFCSGGAKADCNTVLDTNTFKFADGAVSPGSLAFAYFFAGSLILMIHLSSSSFPPTIAWLSLATVPVVIYSFYYQAIVIKKWCRFCVIILGVLAVEVLAVLWGVVWEVGFYLSTSSLFLFLFTGVILGWVLIKPTLGQQEKFYKAKREIAKLKGNKELFELTLSQSKKIKNEPQGLGILMKGEKPKYQIIKVCNPYCGPCARVHPVLESLFDRGNINLQILFTPQNGDGQKENTVRHLMAVESKGISKLTRQALDDWYGAEKKDYGEFAANYPMNGELKLQEERVKGMEDWCKKENISHTPTLFINGSELPKDYKVEDLHYVLV